MWHQAALEQETEYSSSEEGDNLFSSKSIGDQITQEHALCKCKEGKRSVLSDITCKKSYSQATLVS